MSVSRREFGQSLAVAAVSMSVESAGIAAQSKNDGTELCDSSAVDLAARLRTKEVSAREVMAAHLAQIERVNPRVNAIVTLVAERAMADAARADEAIARGDRSARCTACRSRTRTSSTPRASARRAARRSIATMCPTPTR